MNTIVFTDTSAAIAASILYETLLDAESGTVIFPTFNRQQVKNALILAGLDKEDYRWSENRCLLPFPKHERECTDDDTPKIYVACLSAYNNGFLHGMWIDATQDADDIQSDIDWMLSWSPVAASECCEEWAIHCFEGFDPIQLSEYESLETVSKLAEALQGENAKVFAHFYNDYCSDDSVEDALEKFEERYLGTYEDVEDFAYEQWESDGRLDALEKAGIPDYYLDWGKIANDYEIGGDYSFIEIAYKEHAVFSNY